MKALYPQLTSYIRVNKLTGDITIVSNIRRLRPKEFKKPKEFICPFCPGREELTPPATAVLIISEGRRTILRDTNEHRVRGWQARIFPNKFPALTTSPPKPLRDSLEAYGYHEVLVEFPQHSPDPHNVDDKTYSHALWLLANRIAELYSDERIVSIVVIKNRGPRAGASILHSHMQIFALPLIPPRLAREVEAFKTGCPLCELIENWSELLVHEEKEYVVMVNPAPRAPYEVWIIPKRHKPLMGIEDEDLLSLAKCIRLVTKLYVEELGYEDYNAWIHVAPKGVTNFHWHVEFSPLSVTWGGLEKSSEAYIVEVPPEDAAKELRSLLARLSSN